MPFNIDLTAMKMPVKLQIINNIINLYFYGEAAEVAELREKWSHLIRRIEPQMPLYDLNPDVQIGSMHHQKKHHTNAREVSLKHAHVIFTTEVTPELLTAFLNNLYWQQRMRGEGYRFFHGQDEVNLIIETFTIYYKNYKGSTLEADYEEGTRLTAGEIKDDDELVQREEMKKQEIMNRFFGGMPSQPAFASKSNSYKENVSEADYEKGMQLTIKKLEKEIKKIETTRRLLSDLFAVAHKQPASNTENEFNRCPLQ